ncbi:MAG: helix-turn-helix domain-containing protein [Proteobacteria bacterium]|nr:helix-turn-helix domain-containing protein [Pseudomonadota bacterium]
MNVHKNARLTLRGREILISRLERGKHPQDVATAMGVSASTAYTWRRRHRARGLAGLRNRSSMPNDSPTRTTGAVVWGPYVRIYSLGDKITPRDTDSRRRKGFRSRRIPRPRS